MNRSKIHSINVDAKAKIQIKMSTAVELTSCATPTHRFHRMVVLGDSVTCDRGTRVVVHHKEANRIYDTQNAHVYSRPLCKHLREHRQKLNYLHTNIAKLPIHSTCIRSRLSAKFYVKIKCSFVIQRYEKCTTESLANFLRILESNEK